MELEEREGDPCAGRRALRTEAPAGDLGSRNVDEVSLGGVVIHVVADLERDVAPTVEETGFRAHQAGDPWFFYLARQS